MQMAIFWHLIPFFSRYLRLLHFWIHFRGNNGGSVQGYAFLIVLLRSIQHHPCKRILNQSHRIKCGEMHFLWFWKQKGSIWFISNWECTLLSVCFRGCGDGVQEPGELSVCKYEWRRGLIQNFLQKEKIHKKIKLWQERREFSRSGVLPERTGGVKPSLTNTCCYYSSHDTLLPMRVLYILLSKLMTYSNITVSLNSPPHKQ